MLKKLMPLVVLLAMLPLTSCGLTMGTGVIDTTCLTTVPISWSVKDTDETIKQIKEHNAAWSELCGK